MPWVRRLHHPDQVYFRDVFKSLNGVIHVRADSSPQFTRDLFVAEVDVVSVDGIEFDDMDVLQQMWWRNATITRRLLPIQQIGVRSGSASHLYVIGIILRGDVSFRCDV